MQPISLHKRFFANTTLVAIVVMLISVFIVDISYRSELQKSAYDKLRLHIFTLLSIAKIEKDRLSLPDISYHPRLNEKASGLWAGVLNEKKQVLWHSLSISELPPSIQLNESVGEWQFNQYKKNKESYLTASYKITWDENRQQAAYYFIVAENKKVLNESILRFRLWLFGGFFSITFTLLLSQFIALFMAFKPINTLEKEIMLLENGEKNHLSGNYPKELSGVTTQLNALIDKERKQRNRYRSTMADLAHSLKTPMAVINAEVNSYRDNQVLQNAIKRIDNTIEYQLRRAVISGHSLLTSGIQVRDVIDLVLEALDKIYHDRHIKRIVAVDQCVTFSGDENDLMEIIGNLLDNAYKHAKSTIKITVEEYNHQLNIAVEDDGDGLTDKDSFKIFTRGERLDQQNLGQGIGLAVIVDIVNSYHGEVTSGSSNLGGALFTITLPMRNPI